MPSPHPPNQLSTHTVRKVAHLARLAIPEDQLESYRTRLAAVLDYAAQLQSLDLAGVDPMSSPLDATSRAAPDHPGPTLPTETLMQLAPDSMPPFVKVPKVLGEGSAA